MIVIMRNREGKAGGGKGPMLGEDKSFTLATANDQIIFILDGTRVNDVRFSTNQIVQTVISRWGTGGGNVPAINKENDVVVRRLTPMETERLQGFPDDWTDEQADSHRYKQMGNAVTVNVARWIGSRL